VVPVHQHASCYFASNFILVPNQESTHGYLEFLLPLLKKEPPKSALHHAFNACALASIANRRKAAGVDLADMALKEHTEALNQMHITLSSAASAKSDAALATVLLLSLYEVGLSRLNTAR
jgi:hypothetical protein